MSTDRLLILDGHSIAFRAFYALPPENFQTRNGTYTNAVHGFISMLLRMVENEEPTRIAVAFDVSRKSFRTDIYPEYKGTRGETPEAFHGQVELIEQALKAMGIVSLKKDNYEADDILATLAKRGSAAGLEVLVASGDRDTFQLVNENVTVLYPGGSISDLKRMTPSAVEEKYGVGPQRYPEIAALVGETSDNLPGVPGVGPKTAAQWLNKFDGLDVLLEKADQIGGVRGKALREHLDDVKRNRQLNRLLDDLEIDVELEDLHPRGVDAQALDELFDVLEFRTLRKKVFESPLAPGADTTIAKPQSVELDIKFATSGQVSSWLNAHRGQLALAVSGRLRPGGDVSRLALAAKTDALVIDPTVLSEADEVALRERFSTGNLIVAEYKGISHAFTQLGWKLGPGVFDVALAAYLLHPDQRSYAVTDLARRYLGRTLNEENGLGTLDLGLPDDQPLLAHEAGALLELHSKLLPELKSQQALKLLEEVELPVARILTAMEATGIAIDLDNLRINRADLEHQVAFAASEAFKILGHEVNLSSPKQLQEVLFNELDMPKTKRTKTGWTTNAEALNELHVRTGHPFLTHLLEHRDKIKLRQIIDTLISEVEEDDRIRTTFEQTVAATGRLSSVGPNLQNIPARSSEGLRIREAFVPGTGFESLMTVDYSQIEMRIMAHLSADEGLISAFRTGEDLHTSMAAMVFNVAPQDVDAALRSRIKATSYGLAYGLSAYGLSKQLGVDVGGAAKLMDQYFERFGGVRDYLREVVEQARKDGYTQTLLGRRRYLPDLDSVNRQRREIAERAALNAPIQGSAADIIKLAMISVDEKLAASSLKSRVLLQVHDELVLEVASGEEASLGALVSEAMGGAYKLSVPLEVGIGVGASWRDAAH